MPFQTINDPYARGGGGPAAEQFSNTINSGLQQLLQSKLAHQQQRHELLKEHAAHERKAKLWQTVTGGNKDLASLLTSSPEAVKEFVKDPSGFLEMIKGAQQPATFPGQQEPNPPSPQQPQQMPARGPMNQQQALQQALQGGSLNAQEGVGAYKQDLAAAQGPKIAPKEHSAQVLLQYPNPVGKRQEAMVKRAQDEQDRLEKRFGKEVDERLKELADAEQSDALIEKQAELINSGKMPSPTAQSVREGISHGGLGKIGAGIGGALGGIGGAAIGGALGSSLGVDLSQFSGSEGNELLALNVPRYEEAGKLFKRLTEHEFGKYEQVLPLLTDTDEVKMRKLSNRKFINEEVKVIGKHIQAIKDENGGYLTRDIISDAEKRAKPELHALRKAYKSGQFGFKLNYISTPRKGWRER